MIDADGHVKQSQKARLFTAVAFENLEQDIARGNGEYLTSLGVLLNVSAETQEAFRTRAQNNYPVLFASDRRTAEDLLTMMPGKMKDRQTQSQQLGWGQRSAGKRL